MRCSVVDLDGGLSRLTTDDRVMVRHLLLTVVDRARVWVNDSQADPDSRDANHELLDWMTQVIDKDWAP